MNLDPRLASVVEAGRKKKATNILLLDLQGIASFTDVMAFMSGTSDRQNRAIADSIQETLKLEFGERAISREGEEQGHWILLDFGDLIVHVMDEETRRTYQIEALWRSGRSMDLPPESLPTPPSRPIQAAYA